MRDYGRVHTTFWSSPNIRTLSDDGRALALYVLTSPHTTITGTFRLPDGYVCEDMQWTPVRVAKGFKELFQNGFANRCETTKWVWIAKFLEWNPPENPNQWKAARKIASLVPEKCSWSAGFRALFAVLAGDVKGAEVEPLPNGFGTLSKPGVGTGTGTGTEEIPLPGEEAAKAERLAKEEAERVERENRERLQREILDAYHELLPGLPSVRDWNDRRKQKLNARIDERVKDGKPAETVEYWRRVFEKAAASDLLTGRKTEWRADLEWLLEPRHFTRLIEGSYDNVERRSA